MVEKNFVRKRY